MLEQTPNLPKSFQKIRVYKLTNDFEAATKIDNVDFQDLLSRLKTGQVIVKYDFVGINASDINFTAGRYDPTLKPPFDCGFEGLGTIVVRDGKAAYKLGQPVAVMSYGCFSEYQIAAAGGAGQIAVQLAKLAGNHVIGTCSSGKEEYLKSIGCDRVINYKTEDLKTVLKKEYPNGIDIVFESVGNEMFKTCFNALAVKGRLIVIGSVSNYAAKAKDSEMNKFVNWQQVSTQVLLGKSTTVTGFFLNHYTKEFPAAIKELTHLTLNGKLNPSVHKGNFCGIPGIYEAIKTLNSGKNIGKLVVALNGQKSKL